VLERAIAIFDATPLVQEREPRAHFARARALDDDAEARKALSLYREARDADGAGEVEAWLAGR
jgi:hypothetical protein